VIPTRRGLAAAAFFAAAWSLAGPALADVVVLKGGTVVPLKEPWVRRGNTAYLTRSDGTLLSVPVTEIDRSATAAANQAAASAPAPAEAAAASTPAEAARAATDSTKPKASVRITDADVSHPLDLEIPEAGKPDGASGAAAAAGGPRVEVADYTQEQRGDTLYIKGSIRNVGQAPAEGVRMNIAAIDEKGESIDGTTASLSKGTVGSGQSVEFTASIKTGEKTVATLRFNPQWAAPKPPPPTPRPASAGAASEASAAAPAPRPTPFGRGTMFAPPAPNAPSQPPADGKTGYIPGATSPDNQPKPPSR
jgi:hypothetical protein